MSQLPSDCLNDIFEYLEDDKITLRSCLLVNCLWCEVSVKILWRRIRNYNTLIACLPNDSKEILFKNGIAISRSASRSPMFNYASFCKVLSTYEFDKHIKQLLHEQEYMLSQYLSNNISKITKEIFKFLITQTSLREINLISISSENDHSQGFTTIPGVMGCLRNISELHCTSDIYSEFFYQLSQTCHNIQSLTIIFKKDIPYGLADLISVQQNLKTLNLVQTYDCNELIADIITLFTNLPDTLIRLKLCGECSCKIMLLLFTTKLTNLQELILTFDYKLRNFRELQYVTFSQLQVLRFKCPRNGESLTKFLENNGKNLKEFYVYFDNDLLNLSIAKFCPNLRKLFAGFNYNEVSTLARILNNCQYLESIQVQCCGNYLSEKRLFETLVKYSPKNFHELKLCYSYNIKSELLPEELDTFFTSWTNRMPQKSLSLIIFCNGSHSLDKIDGNMKLIKKYIRLGVVKEFKNLGHSLSEFIFKTKI